MLKKSLFVLTLVVLLNACDEKSKNPLSDTKWFNEVDIAYIEFTESLLKDYEYDGESCYSYYLYNYTVDADHFSITGEDGGNEFTFEMSGNTLTIIDLGDSDTLVFVANDFDASEFDICIDEAAKSKTELFNNK